MGKETYIIKKISLLEKPKDIPMNFPRQPQLYLELIENKKKIKPELVNKDYIPPSDVVLESVERSSPKWKEPEYESPQSQKSIEGSEAGNNSTKESPVAAEATTEKEEKPETLKEKLFKQGTPFSEKYTPQSKEEVIVKKKENIYPGKREERGSRLPTLSELENQNKVQRQKEFIDVEKLKQDDDNVKRELLFKLDILRKTYPKATIDKFTIHDKYSTIKSYYDSRLRMLSLENSVDNYKTYMTFMFMGVETLFGKVFKLDMKGFTEQQLIDYQKYEKLLIEMGESNSSCEGKSKWPVWLRILFVVVVQTAFFVVGKMILGGAASKILGAVSDMKMGGINAAENSTAAAMGPKPNRKMKGPRINLNEIPDHQKQG